MKTLTLRKTVLLVCAASTIMCLISCGKEDVKKKVETGQVQFSFEDVSPTSLRTSSGENVTSILISVEKSDGTAIFSSEEISLYNFGGTKISETFAFPVGNYRITEFHLIDDASNILFSAPLAGSELAYLVDNTLPLEFSVSKDEVKAISPEVLSVEGFTAEDFGYISFAFNVINTVKVLISALVFNPLILDYELTDATIVITNGTDELYNGSLAAATNTLTVRDGEDSYVVTISKDGYATYNQTFTAAEFQAFVDDPLSVFLEIV